MKLNPANSEVEMEFPGKVQLQPALEFYVDAAGRTPAQVRCYYAVVVERVTGGAATLDAATPVMRVDFETATHRLPLHQFSTN